MIKTCWILIAMMAISFGCGKKASDDKGTPVVVIPGIVSDEYLMYVNQYRAKLGLNPLEDADIVMEQAQEHASAMADKKRSFGHYQKEIRCRRIRNAYGTGRDCGEIIAMGPRTARELFDNWMSSSSNRQSIEAAHYTHSGLGLKQDRDGVVYWTQMFYSIP
jgi:uncharacterized protein YkwD